MAVNKELMNNEQKIIHMFTGLYWDKNKFSNQQSHLILLFLADVIHGDTSSCKFDGKHDAKYPISSNFHVPFYARVEPRTKYMGDKSREVTVYGGIEIPYGD